MSKDEVDSAAEPSNGAEEEEETCGFCIFMKGGGCKEAFEVGLDTSCERAWLWPSRCKTCAGMECMRRC